MYSNVGIVIKTFFFHKDLKKFFYTNYYFIFFYFWLHWVFIAACRLYPVVASRGCSSLRCAGFSLWWLLLLPSTGSRRAGSVVVAHGLSSCGLWALELRLSSFGTWAQLLWGMWDPPGPGLEPVSPALAGGLLTTAPPGKSLTKTLNGVYVSSILEKHFLCCRPHRKLSPKYPH